jgi:pimeloyl-ACP methyl ester carboxylesterase
VYVPTAYDENASSPLQWWFHFRGGTAHIAAAGVTRVFDDMGEDRDALVVSPRGRGTSTWYVGKGHVDFQEVWADVHRTFAVDRRREYVSGHSMGGWATYLMTILYPDRFAAGLPASAPVTQGGWTGVDFEGCDELTGPDGESPCFTGANGGRPRDQFTRPLLENTRWTPLAIYQGTADELVPTSGVLLQADRLRELGHRLRALLLESVALLSQLLDRGPCLFHAGGQGRHLGLQAGDLRTELLRLGEPGGSRFKSGTGVIALLLGTRDLLLGARDVLAELRQLGLQLGPRPAL